MSRWIAMAALVAILAACGPRQSEAPAEPPVVGTPADHTMPDAPASAPAPQPQAVTGPLPQALPAPTETTPRFVGLWATDQRLCANPAWRFEANQVSTRGEVHCDFNRVLPVPAGYSVQATCTAEGPPAPYEIEFTFAESARAMMLAGGPWAHASLVYCGPLTGN